MVPTEYAVELSPEERTRLNRIVTEGTSPYRMIRCAKILLALDLGNIKRPNVSEIAETFETTPETIWKVRDSYCRKGLDATLNGKSRVPAKLTGEARARISALACGEPPEGNSGWTARLLAEKAAELGYVDSVSASSARSILTKKNLDLARKNRPEPGGGSRGAMRRTIRRTILGMDRPFNELDLFHVLERDHGIRDRDLILIILDELSENGAVLCREAGDGSMALTVAEHARKELTRDMKKIPNPAVVPEEGTQDTGFARRFIRIGTPDEMDKLFAVIEEKNLSKEDISAILRAVRLNPNAR